MFDGGIRNLLEFLRFLCLCVVFERGSWSPPKTKLPTPPPPPKDTSTKPEWMKEWTISKGWIHNRTHLLTLGKQSDEEIASSSISTENIDELISNDGDFSLIFQQISENYRENFPEINANAPKSPHESNRNRSVFVEFWRKFNKQKTVELGQKTEIPTNRIGKNRTNLGRNIAIYNTLNSRTNLHEEPIYECSEENQSIYNNPIYSPLKYYDFHSNHQCANKFRLNKNRRRTEKYVIRHIKIRIMLSLRIGRFKKRYKHLITTRTPPIMPSTPQSSSLLNDKNRNRNFINGRETIQRIHEEQKRIGNGRTSIKIQNMRYGRLNVLRWLLWEAEVHQNPSDQDNSNTNNIESDKKMPALERPTDNTTLALHYAAARGCLDCVRLLVDSTPDLSANTQMDNDVTPVYLAAQEGHLDVLKFLVLEAGGSLYVRAKDGMAPIHAASQMGCLNCVKWMIQEQGVDPNLRDGDGATPLHFAASRGHLETVRWLLKHGARLSLDKYGKSPINDAAENQQVECLNVLVQHGTTPDYDKGTKSCSCTARKSDQLKRETSITSDCSGCKSKNLANNNNAEPFYLHPPLGARQMEAAHAPQDGLYINPMNTSHKHSASNTSESSSNNSVNGGESFYLHNPQEVIYNRVKDLFEAQTQRPPLSALTVKVEVHSSSSGAGSDENLSSSDLSEQSIDHDHDYEDIYLVREETKQQETTTPITTQTTKKQQQERSRSRDSGSHSRSNSTSSSNSGCNLIVKVTPTKPTNQRKDDNKTEQAAEQDDIKTKLGARNSAPPANLNGNNKILKRAISTPGDLCPPPPPPPLPIQTRKSNEEIGDEPRGAETVEIVEEPTLRPSEIAKGACRTMSALTSRRLNSSCSDLTIVSLTTDTDDNHSDKNGPNLINKQRALPFIPPNFSNTLTNSNNLIKPSEYLRSISDKRASISSTEESIMVMVDDKKDSLINGPPPPPLPDSLIDHHDKIDGKKQYQRQQPLSAISIQDLNSVQLRRTNEKLLASKTLSAPPTRSLSLQCLQTGNDNYMTVKTDLIAELKLSKDITGIKKMKIERAKVEESKEKELYTEISRQFTATKFVEKIPDKDNTGNIIPAWKRQMLAKKAAERARKELEEQMQREAEEKRLQAIPQWKRQLMAKKEETENRMRSTLYTPKVVDDPKIKIQENHNSTKSDQSNDKKIEDINNNSDVSEEKEERDEETNIIPWRAQLRKTNSKLNLLD